MTYDKRGMLEVEAVGRYVAGKARLQEQCSKIARRVEIKYCAAYRLERVKSLDTNECISEW